MKKKKSLVRISLREKVFVFLVMIILCVYTLSLIVPLFWAFMNAGKGLIEYAENPFGFPNEYSFSNFSSVISKLKVTVFDERWGTVQYGIVDMLLFTILPATFAPALTIFFTTVMAYVLERYRFFGSKFLFNLGIVLMILPIIGTTAAKMELYKNLNLYNNLFMQIIIAPCGCFWGMDFLMLKAGFKGIPKEYSEAAFIDGAGHYTVFFKIMLPMVFSTCVVFFLLAFLSAWNNYESTLIWRPSYPTVGFGMYIFQQRASQYMTTVPEILAGFLLIMIPTSIMYLSFQNLIISKLQFGGLKG